MAEFPEVTLRFFSQIRGECLDKKAKIIHGYIVSEKYNAAFPLPNYYAKEYDFTENPNPPMQDSKFINDFLVKVYQDAKAGKLR